MFAALLETDTRQKPREGELFKVITAHGKTFEIRYGYYEEADRHTRFAEPIPLYPDFIARPQHTADGIPFVTEIQNICEYFIGKQDENSTCGDCALYQHCDELLGICACPENKQDTEK